MNWWLWMLVGAVIAVVILLVLAYVAEVVDERATERQRLIRAQRAQAAAERQLQRTMQDAVARMFSEARRQP